MAENENEESGRLVQLLTCIRLGGPILERSDDACEQAPLIKRVAHFIRFEAQRSIELSPGNACALQCLENKIS